MDPDDPDVVDACSARLEPAVDGVVVVVGAVVSNGSLVGREELFPDAGDALTDELGGNDLVGDPTTAAGS